MKRHIPGLHGENHNSEEVLEGIFLVRVDRAFYHGIPSGHFMFCGSPFSNQWTIRDIPSQVVSIAPQRRFGNSAGSCATLVTTRI